MMRVASMVPFRFAAVWLAALMLSTWAQGDGLYQQYCSSENTGSEYQAVLNIYQSNGACHDQCVGDYAFAVVQWQNCWCSNYIPAEQQSTGSCDQNCPGYPADQCGNASNGLYGYIPLYKSPLGTAGASSSTQASSTPASSASTAQSSSQQSSQQQSQQSTTQEATSTSQPPATSYVSQTVYQTVTQSQSASVVVSYVTPTPSQSQSSSSASPPSSTSTTSALPTSSSTIAPVVVPVPATTQAPSSLPPPSATLSPITSVQVITVSGAVVTQTVTSAPFVAPGSNADAQPLQRKQLSGGAIAGIVIGTLLFLAALLLGACLLWRRRRRDRDAEILAVGAARGPNSPRRNISVLSRTGLLSRGRPTSMAENNHDEGLHLHTGNNSVRHSMLFGAAAGAEGGVSPVSPLGSTHENDSNRRYSRPMIYDQRLNPSALFANAEANGSRVSMQDQQDYSRPLGIANPDPRPSFESRASHP